MHYGYLYWLGLTLLCLSVGFMLLTVATHPSRIHPLVNRKAGWLYYQLMCLSFISGCALVVVSVFALPALVVAGGGLVLSHLIINAANPFPPSADSWGHLGILALAVGLMLITVGVFRALPI